MKRYEVWVDTDENDGYDGMRGVLHIEVDGKVIKKYHDGGESEDNLFMRDWSWVEVELCRAYKIGLEHGNCKCGDE